jgi:hypothetical protein
MHETAGRCAWLDWALHGWFDRTHALFPVDTPLLFLWNAKLAHYHWLISFIGSKPFACMHVAVRCHHAWFITFSCWSWTVSNNAKQAWRLLKLMREASSKNSALRWMNEWMNEFKLLVCLSTGSNQRGRSAKLRLRPEDGDRGGGQASWCMSEGHPGGKLVMLCCWLSSSPLGSTALARFSSNFSPKFHYVKKDFPSHRNIGTCMEY